MTVDMDVLLKHEVIPSRQARSRRRDVGDIRGWGRPGRPRIGGPSGSQV